MRKWRCAFQLSSFRALTKGFSLISTAIEDSLPSNTKPTTMMLNIVATIFYLLGFAHVFEANACSGSDYELNDVGRRSPGYVVSASEPFIKDSTLLSGWYVAKYNGRLYTMAHENAPQFGHCGTLYPIYLKDAIPSSLTEGKEYNMTACLVSIDNNCKIRYDINIRRCSNETQYFLRPTDGESAYCFEPSSTEVVAAAPNYIIPGGISVTVALIYAEYEKTIEPELDFKCNFDADNKYFYEVKWAINGRIEKTFPTINLSNINSTNLNEKILRALGFSLGISIQCWVSVLSEPSGNKTSPQRSDVFYAGVQISPLRVELESGSSADIEIWPTVPLGCRIYKNYQVSNGACTLDLQMIELEYNGNCGEPAVRTISNQKLCGTMLTGWANSWTRDCIGYHKLNSCTYTAMNRTVSRQKIPVKVTNDQLQYPADRTFKLQLKTPSNAPHTFWEKTVLDEVAVIYSGGSKNTLWKGKMCSVRNDPNVVTFDEDNFYLGHVGFFLLYKNTKRQSDIQIKTQSCTADSTASCTCAVAIQAGGDVFIVDVCNTIKYASFSHCRGNVLNVREISSKEYIIYLPFGTSVMVKIDNWIGNDFLNIDINPSPSDVGNTEGICGNLDGIKENPYTEYPNRASYYQAFILKWKLINSNINTVSSDFLPSTWNTTDEFCLCNKVENPEATEKNVECSKREYATCNKSIELKGEEKSCVVRTKRSTKRHTNNITRIQKLNNAVSHQDEKRTKRSSESKLTETEAYEKCLRAFMSKQTYNLRDELPAVPINDSLIACTNDVMRLGEFWIDPNFDTWLTHVSSEITRNKTYTENNQNVVNTFRNITCPFQCNGNGECVNGSCVCWNGFVGDSCFVQISALLEMTDVEGGGFCDLQHGDDCHECFQFHTNNLLKGFKCQINLTEVDINGDEFQTEVQTVKGEYENIFEGYCCPSAVVQRKKRSSDSNVFTIRYNVAISNDGVHYGPGKDVHVFDSKCQEFVESSDGSGGFHLKDSTCFINGLCYKTGDSLNTINRSKCCPSSSKYQGIPADECNDQQTPSNETDDKTVVIASCVAIAGVIIIVCLIVMILWKFKSNKCAVNSYQVDLNSRNQPYYYNATIDIKSQSVNNRFHDDVGNNVPQTVYEDFVAKRDPNYSNLRADESNIVKKL